jgi:hypothetical protein
MNLLSDLSPIKNWQTGESCKKSVPIETNWTILTNPQKFKSAISILFHYPILTLSAHIQRTAGVLPPPFPGPQNQVDYSSSSPLGAGTNVELQGGPQVLHISVDDPVYARAKIGVLKPLEYVAQIPIYVINQSSWFWGWGGFWIVFPLILVTLRAKKKNFLALASFYPIFLTHAIVFILTAEALPRYLMASILLGVFSFLLIVGVTFQIAKESIGRVYEN